MSFCEWIRLHSQALMAVLVCGVKVFDLSLLHLIRMNLRIPAILTSIFIFNALYCSAQPPTLDVVGTGQGGGSVKYNDPSAIGNKKAPPLEYSDVRGKYMWDNEWHPGLIIFKNDHGVKMPQVKLNLLTQDIHYLSKDGHCKSAFYL